MGLGKVWIVFQGLGYRHSLILNQWCGLWTSFTYLMLKMWFIIGEPKIKITGEYFAHKTAGGAKLGFGHAYWVEARCLEIWQNSDASAVKSLLYIHCRLSLYCKRAWVKWNCHLSRVMSNKGAYRNDGVQYEYSLLWTTMMIKISRYE